MWVIKIINKCTTNSEAILLLGASGYIGKSLIQTLLKAGYNIKVIVRQQLDFYIESNRCEVLVGNIFQIETPILVDFIGSTKTVVNCLGVIGIDYSVYNTNTIKTLETYLRIKHLVNHWIQLSSIGVYDRFDEPIVSEVTPISPSNNYEISKALCDQLLIENTTAKMDPYLTILRPSSIIDKNMKNQSAFQLISYLKRPITVLISSHTMLNYVSLDAVVEAILRIIDIDFRRSNKIEIYNISQCISIRDIVSIIREETSKPVLIMPLPEKLARVFAYMGSLVFSSFPLTLQRIKVLTSQVIFDSKKIYRDLEYVTASDVTDTIREMINHENKS